MNTKKTNENSMYCRCDARTTQTFSKVRLDIQAIFLIFERLGKQKKKTKLKKGKQTRETFDKPLHGWTIATIARLSRWSLVGDVEDYGCKAHFWEKEKLPHATILGQDSRVSQGDNPKLKT